MKKPILKLTLEEFLFTQNLRTLKRSVGTIIISAHLILGSTVAFAQIPYYIPTDSLVAWYPFNDNAYDESGNGHDGVANSSTVITTDRCGIPNSAYYFNGQTSQITIPDYLFNGGWNSHTICCWFNSDTLFNPYSNANNQCLINTYPHRGEAISFNYSGDGKYSFFAGSDPPAAVWDMFNQAKSVTNVSAHVWNHIAMVKDGTSYSMYINGVLDTVFQTSVIAVNYDCSLVIGNISQYAVETFFGKLDDFGIWKRALTAAEILTIYNASCNPVAFACNQSNICEKFCIDFTDQSTNNPTSWQWIFNGGSPSSSFVQNPTNICYDTPGIYDITLITSNSNGNDTLTLTNYITVNTTPPFPTITQNGNTLTCSNASSYQWQLNSVDIPGATNPSYTVTQSGLYTVVITDANGCVNSTTLSVEVTGIENLPAKGNISIYPNPAEDVATIEFTLSHSSHVSVMVYDLSGKEIRTLVDNQLPQGEHSLQLNTSGFSKGVYPVRMISDSAIENQKLIVN